MRSWSSPSQEPTPQIHTFVDNLDSVGYDGVGPFTMIANLQAFDIAHTANM